MPPANAADAIIEAIEAEMPLIVCVTERIPILDMVRVRQVLRNSKTTLVGPNSHGVLAPGICKVGVMSTVHEMPGNIGIVSRSATLTSEIMLQTSALGLGQSTTVDPAVSPPLRRRFLRETAGARTCRVPHKWEPVEGFRPIVKPT